MVHWEQLEHTMAMLDLKLKSLCSLFCVNSMMSTMKAGTARMQVLVQFGFVGKIGTIQIFGIEKHMCNVVCYLSFSNAIIQLLACKYPISLYTLFSQASLKYYWYSSEASQNSCSHSKVDYIKFEFLFGSWVIFHCFASLKPVLWHCFLFSVWAMEQDLHWWCNFCNGYVDHSRKFTWENHQMWICKSCLKDSIAFTLHVLSLCFLLLSLFVSVILLRIFGEIIASSRSIMITAIEIRSFLDFCSYAWRESVISKIMFCFQPMHLFSFSQVLI